MFATPETIDDLLELQQCMLARTQAAADLSILIERGRRCMHLHLPDNSGVTIRALGDAVMKVLDEIERERAAE